MKDTPRFFTHNPERDNAPQTFHLESVARDEVPSEFYERFASEWQSWYGDYEPFLDRVQTARHIRHGSGIDTYVISAIAPPQGRNEDIIEERQYIVHGAGAVPLGHMIVMKETSDPNSFPLVWDVKNEEKARIANAGSGKLEKLKRRGLAELSYHVANQICMEKYGQPIHSGALNEQSVGIWKKLIEQKLAVQERELASDYMSGRANTLGVFRFK